MKNQSVWVADFECTTETDYNIDGFVRCYLWHARRLNSDETAMGFDVDSFVEFAHNADTVWFHNMKYDASFVNYRLLEKGWTYSPSPVKGEAHINVIQAGDRWIQYTIMYPDGHMTNLNDSMTKYPFSLEAVAETLGIEGKSDDDFTKRREPSYRADAIDIARVEGDTRILKTAMEIMYSEDMTHMTSASDAWAEYKKTVSKDDWKDWYPMNLPETFEFSDGYVMNVRDSYRGGWVHVNPRYKGKTLFNVDVYDMNSMYPSMMYIKELPYGKPVMRAEPKPDELYIVSFSASFRVKKGMFPTYQRRNSVLSVQADYVMESQGIEQLTMTCIDYELFKKHYDIDYEGGHHYLCFKKRKDMFKKYIDHWSARKINAKNGGEKQIAKRMLNSLYGKFGQDPVRDLTYPVFTDNGVEWITEHGASVSKYNDKYLPMACFITAYARQEIMTRADLFGDDFVYADTDSIHCIRMSDKPRADDLGLIPIHPKEFNHWKLESSSPHGKYIRAKTYYHADEDYNPIWEGDEVQIKCAGMPANVKGVCSWDDFHVGAEFTGKLVSKSVRGGTCLISGTFRIKNISCEEDSWYDDGIETGW